MDDIIIQAINSFTMLSGVGEKSATRHINDLLKLNPEQLNEFLGNLNELSKIKRCERCNNYSVEKLCNICQQHRDTKTLIILANPSDINVIEDIFENSYEYHVLGGVIDPLKGLNIEDLSFELLDSRVDMYEEFICVLPTTTQGELTSNYIKQKFGKKLRVSKIAQGIPIGGSIEYLDDLTLFKSISKRQEM